MKSLIFDSAYTSVPEESLRETAAQLESYQTHLKKVVEGGVMSEPEAFLNTPSDPIALSLVEDVIARFQKKPPKFVVVVGIGGSNLGTQAVYEAISGVYGTLAQGAGPKLFFLDTIDQDKITALKGLFEREAESASDIVVNIISKSGTTTETIVNAEVLYAFLKEMFGDMTSQVVVTTDKGSDLWDLAEEYGFLKLPIPAKVGGRFSVFSPVGLLPLGLAGISVHELLEGARSMRDSSLEDTDSNPALKTASALYHFHKEGGFVHNSFFFSPRMESAGKWYRQLVGESLGKEVDDDGSVVNEGIVPVVSIGSTDLHSMAQLYFGGPRIFFTTLISVQDDREGSMPLNPVFGGLVEDIENKSQYEILQSLYGGVEATYQNLSLPHMSITFPNISAFTLGQYMQYNMITIIYLAKLMKVNAFDQPNVEVYKKETRRLLKGGAQ